LSRYQEKKQIQNGLTKNAANAEPPTLKFRRDVDLMVEVISILEPNKTVHLERILLPLFHYLVKSEAIDCISSECKVAVPCRGCRGVAVLLFGQDANVGFRSGFR
jgi:hypothetical protein